MITSKNNYAAFKNTIYEDVDKTLTRSVILYAVQIQHGEDVLVHPGLVVSYLSIKRPVNLRFDISSW